MFGSVYWWVVKLGMAAALAIGGVLLNLTGFDVNLGGAQSDSTLLLMRVFDITVPLVGSGIAIWLIAAYPITEERAHEVRAALEQRRGKAG
jgi:GPH family glycoside/pentoside/hexuronide:cation symporter